MAKKHYKYLKFDSRLFGYKVALLSIDTVIDEDELKDILNNLRKNNYCLVYWFISIKSLEINYLANKVGAKKVDEKFVFSMPITQNAKIKHDKNIHSYLKVKANKKIYDLAFQSGVHSRFRSDSRFRNNEFNLLYKYWIEKSLSGLIATDVLVYKPAEFEKGIITYDIKNSYGKIGLFAVEESERGKSIGKILINEVILKLIDSGINRLEVITQRENYIARSFYERIGFSLSFIQNVYHIWLKD